MVIIALQQRTFVVTVKLNSQVYDIEAFEYASAEAGNAVGQTLLVNLSGERAMAAGILECRNLADDDSGMAPAARMEAGRMSVARRTAEACGIDGVDFCINFSLEEIGATLKQPAIASTESKSPLPLEIAPEVSPAPAKPARSMIVRGLLLIYDRCYGREKKIATYFMKRDPRPGPVCSSTASRKTVGRRVACSR